MVPKWSGSEPEVTGSGAEVGQKWTGSVHLSVRPAIFFRMSVRKFFVKLNNGTPHMTIYGAQVNWK